MREINYKDFFNEVVSILSHIREIVVATSLNERVTARTVYCICDDLNLYFITSKAYTKYKQICKNPNIALAINNIQMEGEAEILGHPSSEENSFFKEICERDKDYMEYFNNYSKYKNTILIKVNPKLITVYKGKGAYKYLNLEEKKAYKKGRIN
jgi:uncharacterized pyridoxamine 5'-phosphate oxidase family protein